MIERTFKALTEINADGRVIRRPQSIRALASMSGAASLEEALTIIEPLCADGVSFLKIFADAPYSETELVDISHEALIRNWSRLQTWTMEEAEDAAIYHRLLNLTRDNLRDSSIILGLREARDRDRWWRKLQPNQAWAERYSIRHRDVGLDRVVALSNHLKQFSSPTADNQLTEGLLQKMSGSRWCTASSSSSLQLLDGSVVWRYRNRR